MTDRFISVIIPCFKQAHFLPEAIRSVYAQNFERTEIIVVDDGSPDDVPASTSQFPQVRYIRQQNQGLSAARNSGFQISKGDYIAFLDADDRFLPDALQVQSTILESKPESVFVSGQVRLISTEGFPLEGAQEPLIENDHYYTLLQYCYIWTAGAVLFRRQILEKLGGFNASLKSTGDWDFYLRAARENPVYVHSGIVTEHRRHDGNMTHDSSLMLRDSLAALNVQKSFVNGNSRLEDALNKGIAGVKNFYGEPLVDEIQKHLEANSWLMAIRKLISLYKLYPEGFRKYLYPRLYRSAFSKADSR